MPLFILPGISMVTRVPPEGRHSGLTFITVLSGKRRSFVPRTLQRTARELDNRPVITPGVMATVSSFPQSRARCDYMVRSLKELNLPLFTFIWCYFTVGQSTGGATHYAPRAAVIIHLSRSVGYFSSSHYRKEVIGQHGQRLQSD